MSEYLMKDRAKMVLGATTDGRTSEHPIIATGPVNTSLRVLTLAQRTAEGHIAAAGRQAEKIRTEAQAAADQIARDAAKLTAEAKAAAERSAQDAKVSVDEARKQAEGIVALARTAADKIAAEAGRRAEELQHRAEQRYEDSVGGLAAKREALQEQIEALEKFDTAYRSRLTTFMQSQLRALWVDQPRVEAEVTAEEGLVPQ